MNDLNIYEREKVGISCECEICKDHKLINEIVEFGDVDKMKELIRRLESERDNLSTDSDYWQAKYRGDWNNEWLKEIHKFVDLYGPDSLLKHLSKFKPVESEESYKELNLTEAEALWLAFQIGFGYCTQHGDNGREGIRAIQAKWDQLGLPLDTWTKFERIMLEQESDPEFLDSPMTISRIKVVFRAIKF